MTTGTNQGGWRGSADLWVDAAQAALLEGGIDSVRILPLANSLGIARTSFYWFFETREDLLAALLTRWRDKNTGNFIRQTTAFAESVAEAMLNVTDCWLDSDLFDSRFEFAVRSWALQSPEVLDQVREADATRLHALHAMLVRFGQDADLAEVRARTTYLTQIGYISMQTCEDLALRMARIPAYVEIFTGQPPSDREMARFQDRHGYREI